MALGTHTSGTPLLATSHYEWSALKPIGWVIKEGTHFLREYGVFFIAEVAHTTKMLEVRENRSLQNTYWKTKEQKQTLNKQLNSQRKYLIFFHFLKYPGRQVIHQVP